MMTKTQSITTYRKLRQQSPQYAAHSHTWHIADYANTASLLKIWQKRHPHQLSLTIDIQAYLAQVTQQLMPQGHCDFIQDIAHPIAQQATSHLFEQDFIITVLGTSLLTLLSYPKQLALLRAKPALMQKAIVETLRYDPPLPTIIFLATQSHHMLPIQPGQWVNLNLAAANYDPMIFPEPTVFQFSRRIKQPVLMSHPYILRSWPVEAILSAILQAMPRLRLKAAPSLTPDTNTLRRLSSLTIAW